VFVIVVVIPSAVLVEVCTGKGVVVVGGGGMVVVGSVDVGVGGEEDGEEEVGGTEDVGPLVVVGVVGVEDDELVVGVLEVAGEGVGVARACI